MRSGIEELAQESAEAVFHGDSLLMTAKSYLRGLHHGDRPSGLMPRDAAILTKARRFYAGLSIDDQAVIDSFSNRRILGSMNIMQRNQRFNNLCRMFIVKCGHPQILTTPEPGEERKKEE